MNNWHEVYKKLSHELNIFYAVHQSHSGYNLYKKCIANKKFISSNPWFSKFGKIHGIKSIDPIHVFASLNESRMDDKLRIERINIYFEILALKERYSQIDFSGCPAPFAIKIMSARNEERQKQIWETFNRVFTRGQDGLNQEVFKNISLWYGINISSFTIFLFWIDANNFMPLDKNTNKLLLAANLYENKPSSYLEYKNLLIEKNSEVYRKIAKASYENKIEEATNIIIDIYKLDRNKDSTELIFFDFKLIAVRPLKHLTPKFEKVLIPGQLYRFYTSYEFGDHDTITYDKGKDPKLYKIVDKTDSLDINISAIVGRNGSGKSSITELLYLIINNLTKKLLGSQCHLESVPKIYAELFYSTDTIYKLKIANSNISLFKYEKLGTSYLNCKEINLDKNYLTRFFYSVAINYSHYSLNSKDVGGWIRHVFHKNDAYQAPLVINPMRTKGNININIENELVKSRLLTNILEPEKELRKLTEKGRYAKSLTYSLNTDKVKFLFGKKALVYGKQEEQIIEMVYRYFNIVVSNKNEIISCANKYIYKKLVSISRNYTHYKKFYLGSGFNIPIFDEYLSLLSNDKSHITYKLKQAINFLKYPHLKFHDIDKPIQLELLSAQIQKVIEENYSKEILKTIELIPPSFFNIEIVLDDNSSFKQLSSGEKQKIYTLNSLVYHLMNLNSVSESSELIKYSYVNIIFDEVELYFHPEMQRTFINDLIQYIKKVNLEDLVGLNFCFVTHSPFILSDIPESNILFLENDIVTNKSTPKIQKDRTFGGNIHDLLKDSFFLTNGYMGEFAKNKITSAIMYLEKVIESNKDKQIVSSIEWNQDTVYDFLELIGEPLLRNSLKELYFQAFIINDENEIDSEINRLLQIKKLNRRK